AAVVAALRGHITHRLDRFGRWALVLLALDLHLALLLRDPGRRLLCGGRALRLRTALLLALLTALVAAAPVAVTIASAIAASAATAAMLLLILALLTALARRLLRTLLILPSALPLLVLLAIAIALLLITATLALLVAVAIAVTVATIVAAVASLVAAVAPVASMIRSTIVATLLLRLLRHCGRGARRFDRGGLLGTRAESEPAQQFRPEAFGRDRLHHCDRRRQRAHRSGGRLRGRRRHRADQLHGGLRQRLRGGSPLAERFLRLGLEVVRQLVADFVVLLHLEIVGADALDLVVRRVQRLVRHQRHAAAIA